jgi:Autotransporter beta-domain
VTISTFAGGVSNGGTITVADSLGNSNGFGIFVGGTNLGSPAIATFGGGIANSGTISAGVGILVLGVSTFLGGISNGGTITAGGTGIVVAGISSFSGNVSNSGSITAASGGIVVTGVSAFSGNISNSGSITVSRTGIVVTGVSTFSGNISNSGSITAGNTGIFICSCVTFAGGSIVNTGTITASTGILVANSSPIGIFNSGTIVGTGGTAIDLTAAIGGNRLTLGPGYSITGNVLGNPSGDTLQLGGSGIGSFDLSSVGATQQYQNFITFNVVSGTWTVSNVFGQSQPWNVNGGTLAGTGTLASVNVNSGGTLEPGTIGVPGTFMTITGNLAFQSGASYLVNVNPTTASRANVAGTVTLNGAVLGNFAPGSYSGKAVYDILDPPSISGKFTGFTSNVPGLAGTLTYTSTEVLLTLNAILGSGGGLNVNQQNAANGINNYFNNGGTIPAGFFPILRLTGGNLANALSRLDGEVATDAQKGAFGFLDQFLELMLDPFVDGRSAGTPGMHAFAPEREASLPDNVALAYARALKAPALVLKAAPPPTFRWSVWGAGFGGYNQTNGDPVAGSTNVITRDYGFAGGVDYHFSPDTAAGFALAGGGTNWGLAQGLGSGRSDTLSAGLYGTTHFGPAYVAGASPSRTTGPPPTAPRSATSSPRASTARASGRGSRPANATACRSIPPISASPLMRPCRRRFSTRPRTARTTLRAAASG